MKNKDVSISLIYEVKTAALNILLISIVQDDEDSGELNDIMIKADNAVIVCATNEDEMSHLVIVYMLIE